MSAGAELLQLIAGGEPDPHFDIEVWDRFEPSRLLADLPDALAELTDAIDGGYPLMSVSPILRTPHFAGDFGPIDFDAPEANPRSWILWADCDGAGSVAALERVSIEPTARLDYAPDRALALWALAEPMEGDALKRKLRDLAAALGAVAPDHALPLINKTCTPPVAVSHLRWSVYGDRRYPREAFNALPRALRRNRAIGRRAGLCSRDPLRDIPGEVYAGVLAGGSHGCPLCSSTINGLKFEGEEFWAPCCERFGSIYDFAAYVWGWSSPTDLRGSRFFDAQRRLLDLFATHYRRAA